MSSGRISEKWVSRKHPEPSKEGAMMKLKAALLALLLIGSCNITGWAESTTANQQLHERRDAWKSMSPEERQAKHAEMRQKFDNMTPEQRKAHREAMRQKFENMTPEQKMVLREKRREHFENLPPEKQQEIRARREQRHENWQQHHGNGGPHGEQHHEEQGSASQ
jgi:hypothetical protein